MDASPAIQMGKFRIVVHEHIRGDKCLLGQFKAFLALFTPIPLANGIFTKEVIQGIKNSGRNRNELYIVIDETEEGTQLLNILGSWGLNYGFQLLLSGVNSLSINAVTQENHTQLKKTAF